MKSSAKKVELASVDDLFTTEESRADAGREKVVEISLSELHPFKGHPFKVKDDDAMMETADSIRQYGVLVPAIARPDPSGGYELVAGHRRHRASELAEKETMPVIVRDLDDDAATIIMVDSNLQREILLIWLPSYLIYNRSLKILSGKIRDQKWSNIVDTILCPYMILPILAETLGLRMKRFFVTNKEKTVSRSAKIIYAIPHMILLAATLVGAYFSVKQMVLYRNLLGLVVFYSSWFPPHISSTM